MAYILVLNSNNCAHSYLACLSSEHHITEIPSVDYQGMLSRFGQGQSGLCMLDVSENQAWHGVAVGKGVRRIYQEHPELFQFDSCQKIGDYTPRHINFQRRNLVTSYGE